MTDPPAIVIRVLRKVGFRIAREGARHTILQRGETDIPIPRHKEDMARGTFHKILKQAGLTQEAYVRLR